MGSNRPENKKTMSYAKLAEKLGATNKTTDYQSLDGEQANAGKTTHYQSLDGEQTNAGKTTHYQSVGTKNDIESSQSQEKKDSAQQHYEPMTREVENSAAESAELEEPAEPIQSEVKRGRRTRIDTIGSTNKTKNTWFNIEGSEEQYLILHRLGAVSSQRLKEETGIEKEGDAALGKGNFGKVRIVLRPHRDNVGAMQYMAIKKVKDNIEDILQEKKFHDYVGAQQKQGKLSGMLTVFETIIEEKQDGKKRAYQLMPLANFGTGERLIKSLGDEQLDPKDKADLLRYTVHSLVATFAEMHNHKNPIYHIDFKPDNFLIDLEGNVKVADFGAACIRKRIETNELTDSVVKASSELANTSYFPPEISGNYTRSKNELYENTDLWRLGVTLLHLACPSKEDQDFIEKEILKSYFWRKQMAPNQQMLYFAQILPAIQVRLQKANVPTDIQEVILGLMDPSPRTRLRANEALNKLKSAPVIDQAQAGHIIQGINEKNLKRQPANVSPAVSSDSYRKWQERSLERKEPAAVQKSEVVQYEMHKIPTSEGNALLYGMVVARIQELNKHIVDYRDKHRVRNNFVDQQKEKLANDILKILSNQNFMKDPAALANELKVVLDNNPIKH